MINVCIVNSEMIRVLSNISFRQLSSEELTFDLLFQMEENERDSEELILLDQLKEKEKESDDETLLDDNQSETESQKEERGSMDSIEFFMNLQKEKKKTQTLLEKESIEGSSPEPKRTCPGCSPVFQPNQLAHMCEGGCLSDF